MSELSLQKISEILELAKKNGFSGFSGDCFAAGVAINNVFFDGKGKLVAAFNKALFEKDIFIGHLAVCINDSGGEFYIDADGRPKEWEEIESWGMLDESDLDHRELVDSIGLEFNENLASEVVMIEYGSFKEVFKTIPWSKERGLELERILKNSKGVSLKNRKP